MKNKYFIIMSVVIIILIISVSYITVNNSLHKYQDIKVYKKVNDKLRKVTLTKKQTDEINEIISKESFKESRELYKCILYGTYEIRFDNHSLIFDEVGCFAEYKDKKEDKPKNVTVSSKLINYIISITD